MFVKTLAANRTHNFQVFLTRFTNGKTLEIWKKKETDRERINIIIVDIIRIGVKNSTAMRRPRSPLGTECNHSCHNARKTTTRSDKNAKRWNNNAYGRVQRTQQRVMVVLSSKRGERGV